MLPTAHGWIRIEHDRLKLNRSRVARHPEVRAQRASKDVRPAEIGWSDFGMFLVPKSATADLDAVALRGPLRGHLRVTDNEKANRQIESARRPQKQMAGSGPAIDASNGESGYFHSTFITS
jgi:hypothetical protein